MSWKVWNWKVSVQVENNRAKLESFFCSWKVSQWTSHFQLLLFNLIDSIQVNIKNFNYISHFSTSARSFQLNFPLIILKLSRSYCHQHFTVMNIQISLPNGCRKHHCSHFLRGNQEKKKYSWISWIRNLDKNFVCPKPPKSSKLPFELSPITKTEHLQLVMTGT